MNPAEFEEVVTLLALSFGVTGVVMGLLVGLAVAEGWYWAAYRARRALRLLSRVRKSQ